MAICAVLGGADTWTDVERSAIPIGSGSKVVAIDGKTLRRMVMNMLRHETTLKASIRGKRKRVGWDENYMLKVLCAS